MGVSDDINPLWLSFTRMVAIPHIEEYERTHPLERGNEEFSEFKIHQLLKSGLSIIEKKHRDRFSAKNSHNRKNKFKHKK